MPRPELNFTLHAEKRYQQRGIRREWIHAVYEHGKRRYTRDGSLSFSMDTESRLKLRRRLGDRAYRRIEEKLNFYLIVSSDNTLITVAHRLKKHRRG